MRKNKIAISASSETLLGRSHAMQGFSLLELLTAMAVFVLVAGAAFSLFGQHASMVTQQQNLSGVNIGLRNAMTQMEIDISGAGQNLLATAPGAVQPFSLGIIVQNNVPGTAATCAPNTTSWSYPAPSACFDSLTMINPKACNLAGGTIAPILVITNSNNGTDLVVNSTAFATDPNGGSLTTDSSCYTTGDEVLVLAPNNTQNPPTCGSTAQSNYCMSVITLTKDAQVSGNKIQLPHNPTGAGGTASGCPGTSCTDPLGIVFNSSGGSNFTNALGQHFPDGSFIIDLGQGGSDVTYAVQTNPANASDPQLWRCAGTSCTAANGQAVTDQIISFKVGTALWDNAQSNATDIANYFYNSLNYCNSALPNADCTATPPTANDPNDFSLVRAVRVSLIGRTTPRSDTTLHSLFLNGFDSGPYLVQQAATVVDLRNLSNVDSSN